jgi:hypothetical protein
VESIVGALDSLKKSLVGDEATEIIKSGTLATTRGTGVVAVSLIGAFIVMDSFGFEPWDALSPVIKWGVVIAIGAMWALVAAADSIARGIATAATAPTFVRLPAGLKATRTEGSDSPGWSLVAVEIAKVGEKDDLRFLAVKGDNGLSFK